MNPGETTRWLIDDVKELTGAVRLDNRSYTTRWARPGPAVAPFQTYTAAP